MKFIKILAAITVLAMALTCIIVWYSCNTVSEQDKATSKSGVLKSYALLQDEESGRYYEVYENSSVGSEIIAFSMSQGQLGRIPSMDDGYYPVAYWNGSCQIMDLSQILLVRQYQYGADPLLSQVKVYDFSAYKGHAKGMHRGTVALLIFLWIAELTVGGILILLYLIGVFIFNHNRKKSAGPGGPGYGTDRGYDAAGVCGDHPKEILSRETLSVLSGTDESK